MICHDTIEHVSSHPNSPLTFEGKRRLCERVDSGRPIAHVAAESGVSRATLSKWYGRWVELGEAGLVEKSSRPQRSPSAIGDDIVDAILELRRAPWSASGCGDGRTTLKTIARPRSPSS